MFAVFAVAAALLMLWPATSQAGGLAFRDERTISVPLGDTDRLAAVSLCNTGQRPLKRVAVTVKGLGFTDAAGERLPDTRVIVATTVQKATPPRIGPLIAGPFLAGRCRTVILRRAPAHGAPAAGRYDGIVAAVAKGGGLARRQLRVTVANTEKTPATATALSPDIHLVARTRWPLLISGDADLKGDQTVALVREVEPGLPRGCTPSKAATPACFVGNLAKDTDLASVYVAGPPQAVPAEAGGRAHAWRIRLFVQGADAPGNYKGALDFGPGGEASKPKVNLTLAVGDRPVWPILLVLLLQAIGVGWLWRKRRHTPHNAFEKRLDSLVADYASAAEAYHEPGGAGRHLIRPTQPEIEDYADTVRAAVQAYHESTLLYEPSSAAYKAILASIDEVEADIASWGSTLGPALDTLHVAVTATADALPHRTPRDIPALLTAATALLARRRLQVGEAVECEASSVQMTAALGTLQSLLTDLRHGLTTLIKVRSAERDLEPVDQRRLERASALLDGARWRLWNAKTAEELEWTTTRERISSAQLILDELLPDTPPVATEARAIAERLGLHLTADLHVERLGGALESIANFVDELIEHAEAAIGRAARSAVLRKAPGRLLDAIVFLVSAAAAVIGALAAVSIGDTFGTAGDYLKLFAAAVTGPAVGAVALAAVGRLRALRSDPLLRAEAKPAEAKT